MRFGTECHDCGELTDAREADEAGRCGPCTDRSFSKPTDPLFELMSAVMTAAQTPGLEDVWPIVRKAMQRAAEYREANQ